MKKRARIKGARRHGTAGRVSLVAAVMDLAVGGECAHFFSGEFFHFQSPFGLVVSLPGSPMPPGECLMLYAFALVRRRGFAAGAGVSAGVSGGINSIPNPLPLRQWVGVLSFPARPVGAQIPSLSKARIASAPSVKLVDASSVAARAKARECVAM